MYIKINKNKNQYPYNINDIFKDNPQTCFCDNIRTDFETLAEFNIFKVNLTNLPQYNYDEIVDEIEPILIDGEYFQQWKIRKLTESELKKLTDIKTVEIKQVRDNLLKSCDWTQLDDVSIITKEKWKEYRQALRDITLQDGFPFTVIFPIKPD